MRQTRKHSFESERSLHASLSLVPRNACVELCSLNPIPETLVIVTTCGEERSALMIKNQTTVLSSVIAGGCWHRQAQREPYTAAQKIHTHTQQACWTALWFPPALYYILLAHIPGCRRRQPQREPHGGPAPSRWTVHGTAVPTNQTDSSTNRECPFIYLGAKAAGRYQRMIETKQET